MDSLKIKLSSKSFQKDILPNEYNRFHITLINNNRLLDNEFISIDWFEKDPITNKERFNSQFKLRMMEGNKTAILLIPDESSGFDKFSGYKVEIIHKAKSILPLQEDNQLIIKISQM